MKVVLRKEARETGLEFYFTGQECSKGHLASRYTSTGQCVECMAQRYKERAEFLKEKKKENYKKNKDSILDYQKQYYEENKEQIKKYRKQWGKQNRGLLNAHSKQRKVAKKQRAPKWLTEEDHFLILQFYIEASNRTKEEGISYHVDHIVPLQGKLVSGLHVPWNLQVLVATENMRKKNKFNDNH